MEDSSSTPEEQEMKIFLKVIKTVALKVKGSDSIKNVKAKLQAIEGIASNPQELFFAGNHMEDVKQLADYSISDGSTLNVYVSAEISIPILIKILASGRTMTLELKKSDTILTIKKEIWNKEGIPLDQQTLIYLGNILEDCQTLASSNITKSSTLLLISRPSDGLRVFVNICGGKTFSMEVKSWYRVWVIKCLIQSLEDISPYQQRLVFARRMLDDSRTLSEYKVGDGSTLLLVHKMQILVKTWSGKTITLYVERGDDVELVKSKIQTKMGFKTMGYSLVFAGRSLMDKRTLESYGIQNGSTLHMILLNLESSCV